MNFYQLDALLRDITLDLEQEHSLSSQRKARLGLRMIQDLNYIFDEVPWWNCHCNSEGTPIRWEFDSSEGIYTVLKTRSGWFWLSSHDSEKLFGPFNNYHTPMQIADRDYHSRRNHTLTYGQQSENPTN